jgi:hypothetical protein
VSRPYQTLNNQYSAQVPLSHNCDPRPRTRHLGGGRVLVQAIRQLDKPTEWHRTGCAITTRTQITTLRNSRLSHVTGCAFPLCGKSLGRTQTLQDYTLNSATKGGTQTFAATFSKGGDAHSSFHHNATGCHADILPAACLLKRAL